MSMKEEKSNTDPYAGWEKLYGRSLSEAERLEIGTNLKGFFGLLHQWRLEDEAQARQEKREQVDAQEKSPVE